MSDSFICYQCEWSGARLYQLRAHLVSCYARESRLECPESPCHRLFVNVHEFAVHVTISHHSIHIHKGTYHTSDNYHERDPEVKVADDYYSPPLDLSVTRETLRVAVAEAASALPSSEEEDTIEQTRTAVYAELPLFSDILLHDQSNLEEPPPARPPQPASLAPQPPLSSPLHPYIPDPILFEDCDPYDPLEHEFEYSGFSFNGMPTLDSLSKELRVQMDFLQYCLKHKLTREAYDDLLASELMKTHPAHSFPQAYSTLFNRAWRMFSPVLQVTSKCTVKKDHVPWVSWEDHLRYYLANPETLHLLRDCNIQHTYPFIDILQSEIEDRKSLLLGAPDVQLDKNVMFEETYSSVQWLSSLAQCHASYARLWERHKAGEIELLFAHGLTFPDGFPLWGKKRIDGFYLLGSTLAEFPSATRSTPTAATLGLHTVLSKAMMDQGMFVRCSEWLREEFKRGKAGFELGVNSQGRPVWVVLVPLCLLGDAPGRSEFAGKNVHLS